MGFSIKRETKFGVSYSYKILNHINQVFQMHLSFVNPAQ